MAESGQGAADLRSRTLSGVLWSSLSRVAQQGLQFSVAAVLAHLIAPADFGLVAMIAVFTSFAGILSEMGIGAAVIHGRDINNAQLSTLFWSTTVIGVALSLAFVAAAPALSTFYRTPALVPLTRVMAMNFTFTGMAVIPRALLNKAMRFDRIAQIEFSVSVGTALLSLGMVFAGMGVWAVVVPPLLGNVGCAAAFTRAARFRPTPTFHFREVRPLLNYGLNMAGFTSMNFWSRNIDNLLIGKLFGPTTLGLYNRAYTLMLLPIQQVNGVVGSVMFSALSTLQNDKVRTKRLFLRMLSVTTFVTLPTMCGLLVVADSFVRAIFGPNWVGAVPIIRILCGVGILQSIVNPVGIIYQSQGRADWMFRWGLVASPILIVSIALGACGGSATSVAWGYLIGNLLLSGPALAVPGSLIQLSLTDVIVCVFPALATAGLMALGVLGLRALLPPLPAGARLAIEVVFGVVAYALSAWLARVPALWTLLDLVRARRGKAAGAPLS